MTLSKFSSVLLCGTACLTLLTACNLTPDFHLPSLSTPAHFKEDAKALDAKSLDGNFQAASSNPGQLDTSAWWEIFNEPALNDLETQAGLNNQTLLAAAERINQAEAVYRQTRASLLPTIGLGANAGRGNFPYGGKPITNYQVQANVAYEVDLFGRIRNQTDIAKYNADTQRDLYNQSLLSIHAQVAQNFYTLKALDTERDLLRQTITLRENAQKLIKSRFDLGETNEQDYLRAQNELASAQADLTALDRQRSITEHALSILVGRPPAETNIAQTKLPAQLPLIPAGIPASVLERRPDIASAQKQLAAANAQIGVARAAYFPVLNLTAAGGLAATELGDVFQWSSRSWQFGPLVGTALSLPIFDGGRRAAAVALARSQYQERVANYRQQVLVSFGEVEDALVSLNTGAQQAEQLYRAADASTKANHLSDLRYKEGETSFLEVIDTQRDALAAQRAYTRVQGQRFIDTVGLIRTLGGGWAGNVAPAAQATPVVKPIVSAADQTAPAPELGRNAPNDKAEEARPDVARPDVAQPPVIKNNRAVNSPVKSAPVQPNRPVDKPAAQPTSLATPPATSVQPPAAPGTNEVVSRTTLGRLRAADGGTGEIFSLDHLAPLQR